MTTQLQAVRLLEDDFAEAMQRLYGVGNGLARLRAELEREVATAVAPPTPTPLQPQAAAPAVPVPPDAGAPAPDARQPAPVAAGSPTLRWWQREGAVVKTLVIAGAVVTLAGVTMLLALAVQQGWFGPVPRVVSGAALAVALIVGAHAVRAREASTGRHGAGPLAIAATGFAAAYLDIVAASTIYDLLPVWAGLTLAGAVAGTGLVLARRWDSQLLAVITVLGAAVLAPVLTGEASWVLSALLVVLAAATAPAQLGRAWPWLDLSRTLPVALVLLVGSAASAAGSADHRAHIALTALFAALAATTATRSVSREGDGVLATALAAVAAVPLLVAVGVEDDPTRTAGLTLVAAAYLVATVLAAGGRFLRISTHLRATLGAVGTFSLVLAVLSGAPEGHIATGLLLAAGGYLAVAGATRSRLALGLALSVSAVAAAAFIPHVVAIVDPSLAMADRPSTALLDSVLAGGAIGVFAWSVALSRGIPQAIRRAAVPLLWVGGLAATLTAAVSGGLLLGQGLDLTRAGFVAGHAVATLAWMCAAAWLLVRGLKRVKDAGLALRVGLVLAGVSVTKLFLFDLAALSGIWRVVAFIGTGLLLLATGAGYAKALERSRTTARPAL